MSPESSTDSRNSAFVAELYMKLWTQCSFSVEKAPPFQLLRRHPVSRNIFEIAIKLFSS